MTTLAEALTFAAREQADDTGEWAGWCQRFVRMAWGTEGRYASAADQWAGAAYKHTTGTPPPGAPVFWLGGGAGNGHVALSSGNGDCWSTDILRRGWPDHVTIELINQKWGGSLHYAGWTEDICDVHVITPDQAYRWGKYQSARFCTDKAQPGTVALMQALDELIEEQYSLGIYNCRDVRGGTTTSLHGEGRAYDCGLPMVGGRGNPIGYDLIRRLGRAGDEVGVQAVIFDRKIWSQLGDAREYTGEAPHFDHLHIELNWPSAVDTTLATWRAYLRADTPIDPPSEEDSLRYLHIVGEPADTNIYGYTDDQWWIATDEEATAFGGSRQVNARQRDVIRSRVQAVAAGRRDAIDLVKVVGGGAEDGLTFAIRGDHWWLPSTEELGALMATFGTSRVREVNQRQWDLIQHRLTQLASV